MFPFHTNLNKIKKQRVKSYRKFLSFRASIVYTFLAYSSVPADAGDKDSYDTT